MTITFIGHGYVGLVTACVIADFGNKVWVIGHTPEKLERLKHGDPIIYEPGLKEILEKNLKAKRIHFTESYEPAITESDIVFIAVGTPPKKDGEADLAMVLNVAKKVGENLKDGFTVVSCKSTVPVGTNLEVEKIINQIKPEKAAIAVASVPEFLREGTALYDTTNPDRVVIGSDSQKAVDLLLDLHKPLPGKRVITDLSSAELIKYTSNAFLATKISFANLISFYCEKTGANVELVLDAVGLDKRIGRVFMNPGVGYGGSCLPKDIKALIKIGQKLGVDAAFLDAIEKVNTVSRENFIRKITKAKSGNKLAVWGLSFKPDTDDIREAPALYIIESLLEKGFEITAFDPEASNNFNKLYADKINFCENPYDAVKNADALVIITEWNEFKQIDLAQVKKLMKSALIFDGRNIYEPQKMKDLGFKYYSIGRKPI